VRYEPRSWGKNAISFILKNARVALWATPGIGKTGISLAAVMLLRKKTLIKGALVVGPLTVIRNTWPAERAKWEQFHGMTIRMLHGPTKLAQLLDPEPADIYLINYEGLPWLVKTMNERGMWKNEKQPFDMLLLDESSKAKNPSSQRFKILKGMSEYFRRVLELTGSPAPNGLKDVWSQVYLLDDGAALGRFKTHFYLNYFHQTGYGGYELVLKDGADTAIYDAIQHLVLRMDAADYLDMPELVINDIRVELDDATKKLYKNLEDKLLLKLEDATVTPVNAAAAVNKCLQFTGGSVYGDDGETVHGVHSTKLDALSDLLDELGGNPLLVGFGFRHEAARLRDRFGADDVAVIEGGMRPDEVSAILQRWNQGKIRILFAQMQVVSHGLNLQLGGAHNACIYSLPWDLETYEQFIARLWRQGQKNTVFIHRLITTGTIDVEVARALRDKDTTQKNLLTALKERNHAPSSDSN
jgi:SNF2 family DNA or RNA helicase